MVSKRAQIFFSRRSVIDEAEPVEEASEGGENGGEGTATGGEVDVTEERSGTLFDLDLLDCPVCCHALTSPIFQCDNGHIACSSCCVNMRNKCPSCTLPIGVHRNRMMERVLEAIIVPCPNAKHGCTEKFSYGKELVHEKECSLSLCYCPAPGCTYAGLCNDLYLHYYDNHRDLWDSYRCGYEEDAWMHIRDKIFVLQEYKGPLVAIQCFEEEQGVYVTVNCIAPLLESRSSPFNSLTPLTRRSELRKPCRLD
ncbi:E3 ubiquitin-protein ligase SINA-like 2 [Raphanus sativus]|nr:E3 ubiquitin-protein ligase SINA-like 2 [Raphanus sativus]KAJ4874675.1 E3 ubiquitin-protein ligase SINA-like 2 [Raphanus sativus]